MTTMHHRSRERIRILSEVFTPEKTGGQMLDLLDQKDFKDENLTFFEPQCGSGNIVITILERRINAFYNDGKTEIQSVMLTINSLWAIDISMINIMETRKRVIESIITFLMKDDYFDRKTALFAYKKTIIHAIATVNHQIYMNETLTALAKNKEEAEKKSKETRVSTEWFEKYGYVPIDFSDTWVSYAHGGYSDNSHATKVESLLKQAREIYRAL